MRCGGHPDSQQTGRLEKPHYLIPHVPAASASGKRVVGLRFTRPPLTMAARLAGRSRPRFTSRWSNSPSFAPARKAATSAEV